MFYEKKNRIKKVQFSTWILVYPNVNLLGADTIHYLWWNENDKIAACSAMNREIRYLQNIHPNITIKQAMQLLYQPNNKNNSKHYDTNNFTI